MPARSTARLKPRWKVCSSTWWRRTCPPRGSAARSRRGKTQNQPHEQSARGYLRASASGMWTPASCAIRRDDSIGGSGDGCEDGEGGCLGCTMTCAKKGRLDTVVLYSIVPSSDTARRARRKPHPASDHAMPSSKTPDNTRVVKRLAPHEPGTLKFT